MKSTQETLTATYAAFNIRDIESVLAMMHPAVDWPNGMEGGRMRGHNAVRSYWTRQWTLIDPRVEPLSFSTDQSGRTVVEVHQVVRDLSGHVLADRTIRHVYTFREGLIERMDIVETAALKV
ncbi:MAG TPA: nuclear transport factor 2 family protein [Candidatus Angelobacter sp.]|nr:nuclear transport factor 2 family protein [Candidatus Angelobacter sp.]